MAAERLSGLDTAFLCLERAVTPMQLGALALFRSRQPWSEDRVVSVLAERAQRVPRLRRRVQSVWFPPGAARWADDPGFRAEDHIHLHHLSGPDARGSDGWRPDGWGPDGGGHAAELVSKLMARPLRRDRPLWEFHVISGLADGRFAVLVKLHHALGDGLAALEIGVGVLDEFARPGPGARTGSAGDGSATEPTVAGQSSARSRLSWISSTARGVLGWPCRTVCRAGGAAARTAGQAADVLGMAVSVLRSARLPAPGSPLVISSSGRRGLGLARLDLQQVQRIRARFGGTVNDVLLAVVAGALREYLLDRGHPVEGLSLRALIPVSRRARSGNRAGGNQMSGYLCELPLGEPDPGRRLRTITAAMQRSKASGATRGPGAIPLLAERLPPALHRVVAPVAGQVAALLFDILVTSVPLPGVPLWLDGAELEEVFPVAPLAPGHALGVALSCYRGVAYIGLHADSAALPDVEGLAEAVTASVTLLDRVAA